MQKLLRKNAINLQQYLKKINKWKRLWLVYMLGQNIDSVIYQELIQDLAKQTDRDVKKDII